jgi:hypothetical protein
MRSEVAKVIVDEYKLKNYEKVALYTPNYYKKL